MRRFGLAALQLELGPGDNLAALRSEIESVVARSPVGAHGCARRTVGLRVPASIEPSRSAGPTEKELLPHRPRHVGSGWCRDPSTCAKATDLQPVAGHQPRRRSRRAPSQDVPVPAVRDRRRPRRRNSRCSTCRMSAASGLDLLRHVVSGDHAHARCDGRRGDPASLDDQHDRPRGRALDRAHQCRGQPVLFPRHQRRRTARLSAGPSSAGPAARCYTAGRGREVFAGRGRFRVRAQRAPPRLARHRPGAQEFPRPRRGFPGVRRPAPSFRRFQSLGPLRMPERE